MLYHSRSAAPPHIPATHLPASCLTWIVALPAIPTHLPTKYGIPNHNGLQVWYTIVESVPQSSQTNIDPEFWERLRDTLKSHMKETGLKQKELAPKLGIGPTTLNNFLNRQSKTLGGLAVALACTVVDLVCDGTRIGRRMQGVHAEPVPEGQLVLEFDEAFEFKRESEYPTIVLRKPPARHDSLRLAIRRIS